MPPDVSFVPISALMGLSDLDPASCERRPWNAGAMEGTKRPFKPRDVWAS